MNTQMVDSFPKNTPLNRLYLLFFMTASTFGLFFSSITFLLTQKFGLSTLETTGIVGMFFGLYYALSIIGGEVGDKYIDFKILFVSGKVFQFLSALILLWALQNNSLLYWGLGLFLADSMVSTVSLNMFITNSFQKDEKSARVAAFLSAHIWANVGFLIAFVISGILYHYNKIENMFLMTAGISLFTAFYSFYTVPNDVKENLKSKGLSSVGKSILLMMLVSGVLSMVLGHFQLSRQIIFYSAGSFVIISLVRCFIGMTQIEIIGVLRFCLFIACSLGFWSLYMLTPTFLPLFLDQKVNTVVLGVKLPPQWVQLVCPLTAVTLGNVVKIVIQNMKEKKNVEMSSTFYFSLGLLLAALAIMLIHYGIISTNNEETLSIIWMMLFIFVLSMGEICIAPASRALVGDFIPKKIQGFCAGIAQMSTGISVIISGIIAEHLWSQNNNAILATVENNHGVNPHIFIILIIVALCLIPLLLLCDRLLVPQKCSSAR